MIVFDKDRDGHLLALEGEPEVRRDERSGGDVREPLIVGAARCICGGQCPHVIVTCLDCQESKQVHSSAIAAYERAHASGRRVHAVIVTHAAPSSDGRRGAIQQ